MGLVLLALGLTLNTQTQLGVSTIVSIAYSTSVVFGLRFGDATFLLYAALVVVEVAIHIYLKRYRAIVPDLAQIVLSLLFTRFLNLFKLLVPDFVTDLGGTVWGSMPSRIFFLLVAIVFTGVGAAMSLDMRLIPNPGDGIVQAISDLTGKSIGFVKNCLDVGCVLTTCVFCMVVAGKLIGIGVGTILAMVGVGRVIAGFNYITLKKALRLAGIEGGE